MLAPARRAVKRSLFPFCSIELTGEYSLLRAVVSDGRCAFFLLLSFLGGRRVLFVCCGGVAVMEYGGAAIRVHDGLGKFILLWLAPFVIIGLLFVSGRSGDATAPFCSAERGALPGLGVVHFASTKFGCWSVRFVCLIDRTSKSSWPDMIGTATLLVGRIGLSPLSACFCLSFSSYPHFHSPPARLVISFLSAPPRQEQNGHRSRDDSGAQERWWPRRRGK